jgi:hypothetical protein
MSECIYYLAGYCQLQRDKFCDREDYQKCLHYLERKYQEFEDERAYSPENLLRVPSLGTYNPIEEQEKYKKWATERLSWEDKPFKQI